MKKSNKLNKPAKVLFYKWDDGFKYLGAVQLSSGYATKKTLLHPYISPDESIVAFPIITNILNVGPNFYIDIYKLKIERR
ncbi:hypothetical protein [Thermocrinis minervae]|uniref:hypothetical protein n=1 Tax=Thermocrinis minervae TaxID=381751 RepID=UPI0009A8A789|nr:hypothetical protein [Thermocrinis minervae]